jgi:subtilase family serine protease
VTPRLPRIASVAAAALAALPASAIGAPSLGSRAVCAAATPGHARCLSFVATTTAGLPIGGTAADAPPATAVTPAQFHSAYSLPTSTAAGKPVQTIAIVDAFDHPFIESDLAAYSTQFGLPACTTANGCFSKVNQLGLSAPMPAVDPTGGWELETALDVETAHAICQSCKILLVEANSNLLVDLAAAVETAASLGANAISNSYGGGDSEADPAYTQPGIAVVASAGDSDYGASYPAADPHVVAVGGTKLILGRGGKYGSETVWNSDVDEGTGSGCSDFNSAAAWQTATAGWGLTGCGTKRGIADVAADADPNTGAAVYDSYPYALAPGHSSWWQVGGTSLSAPLIAGVYGLAGNASSTAYPASLAYKGKKGLHDVTVGDNVGSSGDCGTTICHAHTGYDGPTGMGTPKGISSF